MSVNTPEYMETYVSHMAPSSRHQMPVFSQVGKGMPGNSYKIDLDQDGPDIRFVGKIYDYYHDTETVDWELDLAELFPRQEYELWQGVRVINEVPCYVYWIIYRSTIVFNDEKVVLWTLQTPYVKMYEFEGDDPPADEMIDTSVTEGE